MTQIFISYSRKDLVIAEKIINALAKDDLEPWIDWKSIPKGEKFWNEIKSGIENSEIFLFLVSPDSIQSEWCNKEINHAVNNGKRILPIVLRDADLKIMHPEISNRNWIFCRDKQDDFNKAIEDAQVTIHTNFEWLKFHTELQVKALKWENRKDNSRFLRGRELREAEQQLAGIGNQADPQPTKLQREYLLASRRDEDRRRKRLILGLGIGFLVLLGITITAIWQRQIALEQTRIARTSELSARALDLRDQKLDLALLLAVEAYTTDHTLKQSITSLNLIANENPSLIQFLQGQKNIHAVAWSTDGRLASAAQEIIIREILSGEPPLRLNYSTKSISSIAIQSIAWSPSNELLASGAVDGTVIIWDVKKESPTYGQPIHILKEHTSIVHSVAWSSMGLLASGSADHRVIIWSLNLDRPDKILQGHNDEVDSVAWSGKGQLASGAKDNTVIIWDLQANRPSQILKGKNDWSITGVAWSPSGQLASADYFEIILWDLDLGQPARTIRYGTPYSLDNAINSIAWSPHGRLASGLMNGRILIWDLESGNPSQILKANENAKIISIAWSVDEKLASGSGDAVILWEPFSWQPAKILKSEPTQISSLAWSTNGQLASGSWDGTVSLWNAESGQIVKVLKGHLGIVNCLAWSSDGKLASGAGDGNVILWDLENQRPSLILRGHTSSINSLGWSPDGQLASSSLDGHVIVWNMDKDSSNYGQPITVLHNAGTIVDWSLTGELAVGNYSDVTVFDLVGRNLIKRYSTQFNDQVKSITWVSNKQLAIGSAEGYVLIWGMENNEKKWLGGSTSSVNTLSWLPNQQLLAAGFDNGNVASWDLATNMPEKIFQGPRNAVNDIAWAENGQLASASKDGTITIWEFMNGRSISTTGIETPDYWSSQACLRAGRNITSAEWNEYLSWKGPFDLEYRTCSEYPTEK